VYTIVTVTLFSSTLAASMKPTEDVIADVRQPVRTVPVEMRIRSNKIWVRYRRTSSHFDSFDQLIELDFMWV
jgi:hypothetical protein